jgi:hypothetical protein
MDITDLIKADMSEASELQSFERSPSMTPIKEIVWSIEKYEVAQLCAITRFTDKEISEQTKIPLSTIKNWKAHPAFQKYMNTLMIDSAEMFKAKRLMVLSKTLDARIANAEETGDYGNLTGRDTLAIIEQLRKETEGDIKEEESHFMKTITTLLEKSGKKEVEIQPRNTPKELDYSNESDS